ncbi:Cloroperoxidase [Hortaea werneckii]|nr:Cloroperoxidase [Hortaea werneckii]
MKLALICPWILSAFASAHPRYRQQATPTGSFHEWAPAGPDDFRGPCPMLNTLANHGFLPHDGKNLTQEVVTKGLGDGLNFAPALTQTMFKQALPANPDYPNATTFNLDQLNRHNVLEHDASLSRLDAYNGNNHVFNQLVFDETKKYWTEPIITAEHIANSKLARMLQSKATNPEYRFTNTTESFSIGEILAPFIAFGDAQNATVRRDLTVYFFEFERLPVELGWRRKDEETPLSAIVDLMEKLSNASSLFTGKSPLLASAAMTKSVYVKAATFEDEMPERIALRSDGVSGGRENQTPTATCYCGAVQLEVPVQKPGLVDTFICHCADCRKITASMFASNFIVFETHMKHNRGENKLTRFEQSATIASGYSMENSFCSICGTLMYRRSRRFPEWVIPRIGTVDDQDLHDSVLKPRFELFAANKAEWLRRIEVQESSSGNKIPESKM